MGFRVLRLGNSDEVAEWLELWKQWPAREVMAHPEYVRQFARPSDRVVCAVFQDEQASVIFPLILRPLAAEEWAGREESRWDATTPYGYGGPFYWGPERNEMSAFWAEFHAWCRSHEIVSVFCRLSVFPEQVLNPPGLIRVASKNIVVPIDIGIDAIWARCDKSVRTCVRAAEKGGLTVEVDFSGDRLEDFLAVYNQTMNRRGASDWYFFPREFFSALVENLPGQVVFFHAILDGQVVSSDLLLVSADNVYYFLAGTRDDAYYLKPAHLLKIREIQWAASQGKTAFVLGGGYSGEDGIFRFKRSFAPYGETPFRTACLIEDQAACKELEGYRRIFFERQSQTWNPRPDFFPIYRA